MATDMEVDQDQDHKEADTGDQPEQIEPEANDVKLDEVVIKHPLNYSWSLWFFKPDSSKTWEDSQVLVSNVEFVEDFWCLFNHVEFPSKLKAGCDFSLFKQGIKPMWEDAQNRKGGRWLINVNKQQRKQELNQLWMEMLMLLVGEGFDENTKIVCGAVINIRSKGDKIGVWTKDANDTGNVQIGLKLRERLFIPVSIQLSYQVHEECMSKACSTIRSRYAV